MIDLTVILPVYNEIEHLKSNLPKIISSVQSITPNYEIIIAEDGSTDGTSELAISLEQRKPRVYHLHFDERQGRGKALSNAITLSEGKIIVYMDIDLSTDLSSLPLLISSINSGYDIAIGSRYHSGSVTKRSIKRLVLSKLYNTLVHKLLCSNVLYPKISDYQCGFKAFNRESILPLLDQIEDKHWFWDTELLVRSQKNWYEIKEVPVIWSEKGNTKVRSFHDSLVMFTKVMKLRKALRK